MASPALCLIYKKDLRARLEGRVLKCTASEKRNTNLIHWRTSMKDKKGYNTHLDIWMESIEIEVEGEKVTGHMFHVGSADIRVLIDSPFEGFNQGLHIPALARAHHRDQ